MQKPARGGFFKYGARTRTKMPGAFLHRTLACGPAGRATGKWRVHRTFEAGFAALKCKNPPEAGSLNMVPEPGKKCREHFFIARWRADPQGEPQGSGEYIEPSGPGSPS